ncbi:MAG: hypothetical protein AB7O57_03190 [Hyphomicrobiaceae bacterium]
MQRGFSRLIAVPVAAVAFILPQPARALCTTDNPCVTTPLDLGTLGGSSSESTGISADGSVVVGNIVTASGVFPHAFRWSGGVMTDLGTLGGALAVATGANADGSVVVGYSTPAGAGFWHAFRWSGGVMADLGTLGGRNSFANGVNASGSVVVGASEFENNSNTPHAFRWSGGVMTDLGTLGGSRSSAAAVNADGSVVVGYSSISGNVAEHATRWAGGALTDLGTLGGRTSQANAVNASGAVIVGDSEIISGSSEIHAFRWTGGVMTDLGILGGTRSSASAVSGDGSVVVGISSIANPSTFNNTHAFRWTAATGMRDLNTLLASAGVNMAGIVLWSATGISANGQFIVGTGFLSEPGRAYLVRYFDNETTGPIAGVTTRAAVQVSVDRLSDSRLGVMAQQHGLVAPLLGSDKPMQLGNEVGVFAAGGSVTGGGFARFAFGSGFAIQGGLAYAEESYQDVELRHVGMGALAAQYVHNGSGWLHPFAEAGGWWAPNAALTFDRAYMNGAGTAVGTGATHGDLGYVFARAGVLVSRDASDQLAVSAEIGRESMRVDAYAEAMSAANPFEAHVGQGTDRTDLAKVRLQWSHRFSPRLDSTLWAAGAHGFDRTSDLAAVVPSFGTVKPGDLEDKSWGEYGARLGFQLTEGMTIDAYANGVSSRGAIDTRVHVGTGLRLQY